VSVRVSVTVRVNLVCHHRHFLFRKISKLHGFSANWDSAKWGITNITIYDNNIISKASRKCAVVSTCTLTLFCILAHTHCKGWNLNPRLRDRILPLTFWRQSQCMPRSYPATPHVLCAIFGRGWSHSNFLNTFGVKTRVPRQYPEWWNV